MRKSILTLSVVAALAAPGIAAAQAPRRPASPHTITGNMGLFSEYRFRGITQTFGKPAFQGGLDYAHSSGFYAGNWNSNVSGMLLTRAPRSRWTSTAAIKSRSATSALDVGAIYYYYPGGQPTAAASARSTTPKVYIGGSWKWLSAQVLLRGSATTSACRTPRARPTSTSAATFDLGNGWGIVGHYGMQKVKNVDARLQRLEARRNQGSGQRLECGRRLHRHGCRQRAFYTLTNVSRQVEGPR